MKFHLSLVRRLGVAVAAAAGLLVQPLAAQTVQRIDPSTAIDADLDRTQDAYAPPAQSFPVDQPAPYDAPRVVTAEEASVAASQAAAQPQVAAAQGDTYKQDDLIGAAEGLFGKGAEGLARLIEDVLRKQGEPNGYIVGREAGAAFVVGARYGSGTLFHKVEGQMPVYWTGPSIGFDAGANAGNTFILVYNLYDTQQLYERYPAAEGQLYAVGGMNASYLRKGSVVLIPIRVGAGLRLGVNAGYMKFSEKQTWLPF
ncbi:DUF1134 domain-containing protein [Porphyrobacter sp. GA68]|uniref:DUF1134 domain-containing protein n=1 Tax=Porphyrobacter sp. GA68 TaxID=2883480 RepID=UPI001D18061B|nr:DUF1134 domain-containing protein [Porphyrobacter sp. GA68]